MALQKQSVPLNFAQGMDQRSDPKQIPMGKFASLVNRVFDQTGLLTKRNGFGEVTSLLNATSLNTFQTGLVTIGTDEVQAYSAETGQAYDTGFFQPMSLEVTPMVRSATSQTTVDLAIASNGLACSTWLDSNGNSYYQICDGSTGQIIVPAVELISTASSSRVFCLGQYFIVTYYCVISTVKTIQYIAIPIQSPASPHTAVSAITGVISQSSADPAYDGVVANNLLYLAWNETSAIGLAYLTPSLTLSSTTAVSSQNADILSLTYDNSGSLPVIWLSWWRSSGSVIKAAAYSSSLSSTAILAPTTVVSSIECQEITSTAINGSLHIFYEVLNLYSFGVDAKTDYIAKNSVTTGGTVGTPAIILRNVGLGSKATYSTSQSKSFMLAAYGQQYQPTYYLIDDQGRILSKFAYSNGGGYAINQVLPQLKISGSEIQSGYLYADQIEAVNKTQGVANTNGIYIQTGINLITMTLGGSTQSTEMGGGLEMNAGFLWEYDGAKPVEHNFFVWPEDIFASWSATGGSMAAQPGGSGGGNANVYWYQVTYEWSDASGMVHRSAPSVPFGITTTGSGTAGSVTLDLPTLRQTYKVGSNLVRIVVYRWSVGQQEYFQVTSVSAPLINNPAIDNITFTDTLSDASIDGNNLIYTSGGVVEDVGAPAFIASTLFDDRLWGISAEDGTLWFSKQVLESTPVEMSDLLTYFVAPSIGAAGSTGLPKCIFPMDDKLIIFKQNAIYYINGTGPDNTGSNSQYSQPIFITSTVGCSNQSSIVFTPDGLMFQSQNGIWLLGRDLSTNYIGKEVQGFNAQNVTSALSIPGTTQVRFTLNNQIALMYDYYYGQWGTFSNVNALASTLYQGLHTFLDPYGRILQETPGKYLDVSTPVVTSFTTGWINLASLQGFERFYNFYFMGQYITPHKLQVLIAYDYGPGYAQSVMINPLNFSGTFGSDPIYGDGTPYGGVTQLEQWRIFPQQQKCQAFQITVQEIYDSTYGVPAGAGLSISGLNMQMGIKRGSRPIPARQSAG